MRKETTFVVLTVVAVPKNDSNLTSLQITFNFHAPMYTTIHLSLSPHIHCSSIYIRENSIEYNQPTLQHARSNTPLQTALCCGHSPAVLTVRDRVSVVYFDDVLADAVRNDTRPCNPLTTFCCGGRGEEVRLESRYCFDMCYRGRSIGAEHCGLLNLFCCCVPCVPVGCPECLCPCAARKTIYVEDAGTAVKIISKARDDARIRLQVMER